MRRTSHCTARRARRPALVTLGIGLVLLPACNDSGNTTINNQGLDCGLVRADLTGTWRVTFTTGTRSTTSCDASGFNGLSVAVSATSIDYPSVIVFGSDASASFQVQGDRSLADPGNDAAVDPELTGSVQADSCLALFRVWDSNDKALIQCLGTFDLNTRRIDNGACDSVEIDNPPGGPIEATCDLNSRLDVRVSVL